MKRYQTIEMLVISVEDQDVLTLSNGGQYSAGGSEQSIMNFGAINPLSLPLSCIYACRLSSMSLSNASRSTHLTTLESAE